MKKITQQEWLKRFNKKHNNTCDYSQLPQDFLSDTLLTITCNIHTHTYTQLASSHIAYKGCKKCAAEIKHKLFSSKQTDYINFCVNKFGNKFDYSMVNYVNAHTPIIIKCNNCNFEKEFSPNKHKRGKGICLNCETIHDTKTFINKSIEIHNKLYCYIDTVYEEYHKPLKIKCNTCNLNFPQTPASHLNGSGCPTCNKGFHHGIETYRNRQTTLYYIKVNEVYKIGLTLTTIKKRYSQDKDISISNIKEWVFEDGSEAYKLEKLILDTYVDFKYQGIKILKGGNTELFEEDIISKIIPLIEA